MLANKTVSCLIVCTALKVSWTRFGVFLEVGWHQDLVLSAVCWPVQDLLLRLIKGSLTLHEAVRLALTIDPGNGAVEEIISDVLTLELARH